MRQRMNIFTPSPFVSELYVNSNTLLKGYVVLKHENRVYVSRGMLLPLLPFGCSSPTREEFRPPKMRDILFLFFDKV